MNDKDSRFLLVLAGAGLIARGHKLMNAELGELGAPHALGAVLVALALRA
jgi:hypothetical protein